MLGVLLGLGSSIATTAVSSAINNANAERANKVQRDMQRDAMMYNKQQADIQYERGTLASRIRQMRDAGFSPSAALDFSQQMSSPSVSATSAHQANPPTVDFSPVSNAMESYLQREFQGDLQRAQVLATLANADLTKEQKYKVNAEILDIFDNMDDRRIRTYDNHLLQTAQIDMIDAQIEDMKKQRDLAEREFEHKQNDDAEKNRIAEKVGTYNEYIKTFEYIRKLIQENPRLLKNLTDLEPNVIKALHETYSDLNIKFDDLMDAIKHGYVGFSWDRGFYFYRKKDGVKYGVGHF